MPASFYQALVLFIILVSLGYLLRKYYRSKGPTRVRHDINSRLFAESPTFVTEHFELNKQPGFYSFRVEGVVACTSEDLLEIRIVEGTHNGVDFLSWSYVTLPTLDAVKEWKSLYPVPPIA